eukprot:6190510-Pleurochrysis_carterae.AAC.1
MESRFEDGFLSTVYSFSMKKAIEEKYVCDYRIVIPDLVLEKQEENEEKGENDGSTRNAGTSSSSRKRKRPRLTTRINMELPDELVSCLPLLSNMESYKLALQC